MDEADLRGGRLIEEWGVRMRSAEERWVSEAERMIRLKSYLVDSWQDGEGDQSTLVNPSNGEAVATTSTKGLDYAAAFEHARTVGGPALRALTFAERGALLKKASKVLYEAREELIAASILNGGTTRSDAKFDIDGATGTLAYYASVGKKLGDRSYLVEGEGEQLTQGARFWGHHIKTPIGGVAVHINAFNFPAWGLGEKLAVAILAGVPVITKPGTATALLAFRCAELLAPIFPKGCFQFVCGSAGDLLSHLNSQDALAFTGSADTGNFMRRMDSVIEGSVRMNIEADSLNSAVLAPGVSEGDDVWHMFIRDLVKEITQKTGQKCTATRRIFVPKDQIEAVQSALCEELSRIKLGNPENKEVRMGPLASAQQLKDVRAGIDRLCSSGATKVYESDNELIELDESKAFFVRPTLLRVDEPQANTTVHEHEVFGPVSTIMPYETVADAVKLVAMGRGSLVASVYGDDKKALAELTMGIATWSGRVLVGSKKIADQAINPGAVLPSCVHGGPGRAGGGEELGGLRGLDFYMQRTSVQGDRAMLDRMFGLK